MMTATHCISVLCVLQVHSLSCFGSSIQVQKSAVVLSSLTCLNVIQRHSLFILPPSSLHARPNLILGLLIVGAFSQAFFQFTSISSSPVRFKTTASSKRGRNSCYEGPDSRVVDKSLPPQLYSHPPSHQCLTSCPFSCFSF